MHDHSYILPIIGILALLVGPLTYLVVGQRKWAIEAIDGFVLTSVGGLVVMFVMPAALAASGGLAIVAALIGMTLPLVMERLLGVASRTAHTIMLLSALLGLVIHTMFDGAALFEGGHSEESSALALAIVLHRLPVSLAIWSIVTPRYGKRGAAMVLALVAAGTVSGAALGHELYEFGGAWFQLFQAMVAGSLLHVVVHRHHSHAASKMPEVLGGLLGVAVLLVVPFMMGEHDHGGGPTEISVISRLLALSLDAAPALALGFVLAALLGTQFRRPPTKWLGRGGAISQAFRGMAVGLPLPICSCGVVPIYHSLIRAGVPATAAMAFLVATPEIGIESFILSLPLLGFDLTIWRLVTAAVIALATGVVIGRLVAPSAVRRAQADVPRQMTRAKQFVMGLRSLVDDTGPWLVAGIILGAIVEPSIVQQILGLPDWLEVVLFAAAGIPIYVCASGATPLAAAFVWAGVSPGAALAFLMAGPATNVTTFATLTQLHGRRIALAFAMSVLAMSITSGWLLNGWDIQVLSSASGGVEGHAWWSWLALALVALMFLDSLFRKGPGQWVSSVLNFGHDDHDHNHGQAPTNHPLIMKPGGAPKLKGTGFKVVIPKATTGCADCDCDH